MTDLETKTGTVEVSITLTIDGETKTFTANAETDGSPHRAARAIARSAVDDACSWAGDLEDAAEKLNWRRERGLR